MLSEAKRHRNDAGEIDDDGSVPAPDNAEATEHCQAIQGTAENLRMCRVQPAILLA